MAFDGYNSGTGPIDKKLRRDFFLQIRWKTKKEKKILLSLLKIAEHRKISFEFNILSFRSYIDTSLRAFLFMLYAIENRMAVEARELFYEFNYLLSVEQRKQIVNELYCLEHANVNLTVFEDRFNLVKYYGNRQYHKPLIVTFDPVDANKRCKSFGLKFCVENGFDVVHYALASRTQYQKLTREIFFHSLNSIQKKYPKTILYGSSLGGFAALYYSDIFNSDVLALSPYDPYQPYILDKFNRKPERIVEYLDDIRKFKKTSGRVAFTVDRSIPGDFEFYKLFIKDKYSSAQCFFADFYGHPITTILSKTGQLKKIVLDFFQGEGLNIDSNVIVNDSYYYYNQCLHLCRRGEYKLARTAILYALTLEEVSKYKELLKKIEYVIGGG